MWPLCLPGTDDIVSYRRNTGTIMVKAHKSKFREEFPLGNAPRQNALNKFSKAALRCSNFEAREHRSAAFACGR